MTRFQTSIVANAIHPIVSHQLKTASGAAEFLLLISQNWKCGSPEAKYFDVFMTSDMLFCVFLRRVCSTLSPGTGSWCLLWPAVCCVLTLSHVATRLLWPAALTLAI